MSTVVEQQHRSFDAKYAPAERAKWAFHDTPDPLTRYMRDRRLKFGTDRVLAETGMSPEQCSVLIVCGGVGGEGTYFANRGFTDVTVSDFSENALEICRHRDPRLKTRLLNAEEMDLEDASYDFVLVQDGLHHLPRPVLGYTEMLRVARRAVVVIEPHTGVVANLLGREWEHEGDAINYVFRWNHELLEQSTRSVLLQEPCKVRGYRMWNHNIVMLRLARLFGEGAVAHQVVKAAYGILGTALPFLGNYMAGVVIKAK